MHWKVQKKFLVSETIAFEIVADVLLIATRILVVGSQGVNKES